MVWMEVHGTGTVTTASVTSEVHTALLIYYIIYNA